MRSMVRSFLIAGVLAVLSGASLGMEPMPLPEFDVIGLDGLPTTSRHLPLQGKRLLIYVRPHCRPCDQLLGLFKVEEDGMTPKVIVLVGGTVEEAKRLSEKAPGLREAAWYADPLKDAFDRLGLQGIPVALGVRQESVEWGMGGVPSDPDRIKTLLIQWLEEG